MILGMGVPELTVILLVVLVLFGPKNLPKLGKTLGATVKSVREGMEEDEEGEGAGDPKAVEAAMQDSASHQADLDAGVRAHLYRELLEDEGVDERRVDSVMRVTDLSQVEVEDGHLKDEEGLRASIRKEWADFIPAAQA